MPTTSAPSKPSLSPEEHIERELSDTRAGINLNGLLHHRIRVKAATELPRKGIQERIEELLWKEYGGKPEWIK